MGLRWAPDRQTVNRILLVSLMKSTGSDAFTWQQSLHRVRVWGIEESRGLSKGGSHDMRMLAVGGRSGRRRYQQPPYGRQYRRDIGTSYGFIVVYENILGDI